MEVVFTTNLFEIWLEILILINNFYNSEFKIKLKNDSSMTINQVAFFTSMLKATKKYSYNYKSYLNFHNLKITSYLTTNKKFAMMHKSKEVVSC